ncbi:MAG: Sir2 family NAD-dependent protein deacetylase [Firmicutes bacterium]|nr:Sir2 family NAD-dependent protein deacetylase [Bacillota bacterium]
MAGLIRGSSRTFALTGAGISTESGIPDFRSPGTGLWTKFDPFKVATVSALRRDPAAFYKINLDRWTRYSGAQPNPAHFALAGLEREGLLAGVVTQNIDGLHRKAGSRRVWEVHGHLRHLVCGSCQTPGAFELAEEAMQKGTLPPRCVCGGVLRPDVVLFGETMAPDFNRAYAALRQGCDLMLVAGSSLTVYPAASLVELADRVIIVNRDPTPYDSRAAVVLRGSAGQILTNLLAAVKTV